MEPVFDATIKRKKLKEALDETSGFFAEFQSFEGQNIHNIVLLGNIPVIKSDDIFEKTRKRFAQEIDHKKGFLISFLLTVILFLSWRFYIGFNDYKDDIF